MQVVPRAGQIAHRSSCYRTVNVGVRVARIQADRLGAIVNGALVIVQPQASVAACIERQGVRGIDLYRYVERLRSFFKIFLLRQISALFVEAIGISRRRQDLGWLYVYRSCHHRRSNHGSRDYWPSRSHGGW